jgi:general secretion pathway protein C
MANNPKSEVLAKNQAQYLKDMRDTLMKEPAKIWQQVRINPVMKNGKVVGYTLAHNDQGLMAAMNLRKTDIITGVNGQSLSDPATLYGLMDTLAGQQSIELTVNRNGQEQVIQLSF